MLNDVPVKELKAETEEMTAFFEQKYPETVKKIDEGKVLTDEHCKRDPRGDRSLFKVGESLWQISEKLKQG